MGWFHQNTAYSTSRPRSASLAVEQLETRDLLSAATFAVATGIVNSTESHRDFVTQEYQAFLGRNPDANGLQTWVGALNAGAAPEVVEARIVSSQEYINDHGGNPTLWLTGLYNNLLGRAPDAVGLNVWLNALAVGFTPGQVALAFTTSAEREAIIITNDYVNFLGRAPALSEVNVWLFFEAQGNDRAQVVAQVLASNEFFSDHSN
ncbi:MAG TPA: DUF4214 domain-containing protein, partial [Gemmataceae bacterium]